MTYETLIGLLACTGMRPGEALRLHWRDLDVDRGTLRIGRCKFSPERVIPLHPTTLRALEHYRQKRQALFPWGETLFVGATGHPPAARRMERAFQRLTGDLTPRGERRGLRLMDFRHSCAMSLLQAGVALEVIALWLGHAKPITAHGYVEADSRDRTDDAYLAVALAAQAKCLVTYDQGLTALGKPFGIEIVKPAESLRRLPG